MAAARKFEVYQSEAQNAALRLLSRKSGASLDDLTDQLGVEDSAARAIIGRLRAKGHTVERAGTKIWQLKDVPTPRARNDNGGRRARS